MNTERIKSLLQFPLYMPIETPEFEQENVEAVQKCSERLQLILDAMPGRLLYPPNPLRRFMIDFGCHTGWFCRAFARLGWRTVGVDRSPEWLEVASLLNEISPEPKPIYVKQDVLSVFETNRADNIDVALCLSVAMYLFEDAERGWQFFKRVSEHAQMMFFDFGGMYLDRVPFNEHEIGELMLAKTNFQSWRKIGTSNLGRSLFYFIR